MKAMIFAAGLGTRLRPLTDKTPKALVEINGTPLLAILIGRLKQFGINEIIINVHHLAGQIIDFIAARNQFDIRIEISLEDQLLDTGGGLKKAAWFFDDGKPFLLHNVDVLTDLNIPDMLNAHQQNSSLATLAVRQRDTSRYFLFNTQQKLCGWESIDPYEKRLVVPDESQLIRSSFMGVHIISPEIFDYFGQRPVFSIVDAYLEIAAKGKTISGFPADQYAWIDLGRKEHLDKAVEMLDQ